ncbi:MAG: hypothetical protein COV10_00395 [Candidatus Vogelbacteria bacterium CG10_big_fil_rev_8_21_14_0_10_51_16]|uniref:Pycsar effector protein domain-containing protein n=1 Tax=Candidatus Vogelbacteria bacterium CG10_big_fil_rev_8_21_14_0_10_51_16 TaxID=1975045 RepID=A0A2H0RFG5_9BACT|nr:MAG: hypothetical protein COV10_00395 [Candidatus Vogelbacteria bacterium CG10_big_fil_rev_8_21_14_0_10_51_16]
MSENDPKKNIGAAISLVDGILDKLLDITTHLDSQTNILVGISSGVFALSLGQLLKIGSEQNLPLVVLAVFSAAAALVGLFAIHPPKAMRKRGQKESLLYQKHIASYASA